MNNKEKNNAIRAVIAELRKKGFQYRIFWTVAGMKDYNFYHFMRGETSLKDNEIIAIEKYLSDVLNITI